ncbi:hypothetical protein AB1N83_006148 [Pleurotus pulmonarius]
MEGGVEISSVLHQAFETVLLNVRLCGKEGLVETHAPHNPLVVLRILANRVRSSIAHLMPSPTHPNTKISLPSRSRQVSGWVSGIEAQQSQNKQKKWGNINEWKRPHPTHRQGERASKKTTATRILRTSLSSPRTNDERNGQQEAPPEGSERNGATKREIMNQTGKSSRCTLPSPKVASNRTTHPSMRQHTRGAHDVQLQTRTATILLRWDETEWLRHTGTELEETNAHATKWWSGGRGARSRTTKDREKGRENNTAPTKTEVIQKRVMKKAKERKAARCIL